MASILTIARPGLMNLTLTRLELVQRLEEINAGGGTVGADESTIGTHLGSVATFAALPFAGVAPPAENRVSPGDVYFVGSLRVEYVRQGNNTWSLRPGSKSMQRMGQTAPDFPTETFEGLRHETLDGRLFYADAALNWILAGTAGTAGSPGLSAYDIAVNNGFVGTESQWLDSLAFTIG